MIDFSDVVEWILSFLLVALVFFSIIFGAYCYSVSCV